LRPCSPHRLFRPRRQGRYTLRARTAPRSSIPPCSTGRSRSPALPAVRARDSSAIRIRSATRRPSATSRTKARPCRGSPSISALLRRSTSAISDLSQRRLLRWQHGQLHRAFRPPGGGLLSMFGVAAATRGLYRRPTNWLGLVSRPVLHRHPDADEPAWGSSCAVSSCRRSGGTQPAIGITGDALFDLKPLAPGRRPGSAEPLRRPKEYRRLATTDHFKHSEDKVMEFGRFFGFSARSCSR